MLRLVWPILDPARPLGVLLAEAKTEIPRLTAQARAQVVGRSQWRILPGHRVPGAGGYGGRVLLWEAPAEKVERTVPTVEPLHVVGRGTGRPRTDIDPAVVERILAGDKHPSTIAERRLVTATWLARGGSEAELCRAQGWSQGRYTPPQELTA